MEEQRRKELEAVAGAKVYDGIWSAYDDIAFASYVREKLWWALSCILQGNRQTHGMFDLADALSGEPGRTDDLVLNAYYPLGAPWFDNALYYFLSSESWSVGAMSTFCETLDDAFSEEELREVIDFPRSVPDEAADELCRKHLEMKDGGCWGLFNDDECDDGVIVILASKRLGEYFSRFPEKRSDAVSGLIQKLEHCFDSAWDAKCGEYGVIFGCVESYSAMCDYADMGVGILAVGELLDDALDHVLKIKKVKKGA